MKKVTIILSLISFSILSYGQTNDNLVVEEEIVQDMAREIAPFSKLVVEGVNIEVILTQGDEYRLVLENTDHTDKLQVEQQDEILVISAMPGFEGQVELMFRELNSLEVKDVVKIQSLNQISANHFDLISSGTTTIDLMLDVHSMNTKIEGASEIKLVGKADSHYIHFIGAADLKAREFKTRKVVVNISGAGDAEISASEEISGEISGAAKLNFYGDPIVDDIKVTGAAVFKGKGKSEANAIVGKDTVNVKIGGYNLNIIEDDDKKKEDKKDKAGEYQSWAGIGFGVNGFLNSSNTLELPANYDFLDLNFAKSIAVDLNLFEKDFAIIGEYVQLVTGLGIGISNYKFANNTRLIDNRDSLGGYIDTVNSYSKTKFTTTYLTLPLLLEINTGSDPKNSLHISGGLLLGLNLGSKTKVVYTEDNDKKKIKEKGDYSVNPFRYGLTARVGFGEDVAIYANYALSTLFEKDKGPEMYPFTIGVELLFN
ncbi:MAG: DUF2807 domain-containing protein [Bacteroidetes bacterium]|jgi:hypothetical protein|nr:DUF2807 domain-containing protein [Bacteroidota bacterium]MBT5530236.1 DUF2807 domain-containing protein [Cytophagia bacterium]MBT3424216.1 DUF2807 domain-containing protein [Bacteroidota bacterium]MBT3801198.1 DUF2807 domain-containing protein [Bacteroidota bacterium]MBT4339170.1 DUF2807 domain-containing protein [Bacteroidota bacterium]